MNSHETFKPGGGIDHVTCHDTRPPTKVKSSKVNVSGSRNVSAAKTLLGLLLISNTIEHLYFTAYDNLMRNLA